MIDVDKLREQFNNAKPYPHIVLDDFLNKDLALKVVDEFPEHDQWHPENWGKVNKGVQHKYAYNVRSLIHEAPPAVQESLLVLLSDDFVRFLEELTGIKKLYADDQFHGGGIHQIPTGGKLGVHIDFTRWTRNPQMFRRVNILLYLNKDWKEEYGGHLELWDGPKGKGKCRKKVLPILNRAVIFGTGKDSWHGHPDPLNTPEGVYRNSLAAYYYSEEPGEDLRVHSTEFDYE